MTSQDEKNKDAAGKAGQAGTWTSAGFQPADQQPKTNKQEK